MGEGEPVVGDDFKYSTGLTTAGTLHDSVSVLRPGRIGMLMVVVAAVG